MARIRRVLLRERGQLYGSRYHEVNGGGLRRDQLLALLVVAVVVIVGLRVERGSLGFNSTAFNFAGGQKMGYFDSSALTFVGDRSCKSHSIANAWKARTPELARNLEVQELPTKKKPFFYFHLRKAGGSTLRDLIGKAANNNGLSHWIPCFERPCMPFSIPPGEQRHEIYASHLEFTVAMKMLKEVEFTKVATQNFQRISIPRYGTNTTIELDRFVGDPPHSCMTRLRPTVDRVTSCWNFIAVQNMPKKDNPPAHEVDAHDWPMALQSVDCNNEIVRMFGSVTDMTYLKTATACDATAQQDMEKIMERMSHCIITHNDRCEESKEIVDTFLPWMKDNFACDARTNQGKVKKEALSPAAIKAIESVNEYDELLFQFGEALFEEQLKQARRIRNGHR